MINQSRFFEELTILELSSVLAGPAVGMFFAELGAKVIKIENARTHGDVTRRWRLPDERTDNEFSAYYCSVNYKKDIRLLNLMEEVAREEVYQLARKCDVVISNFKQASAEKLGMTATHFQAQNPSIIFAHLSAFGAGEELPAFDVVLQAEAGFLYMTGEPARPPVKMPVALIDLLAAHQLKQGILLGLLHRARTGEGSVIEASLLESAVASLANQATNWLMEEHIPEPMGSQHPNIAPYGDVFFTKDKKPLVIAAGTERQFKSLCEVLGLSKLVEDPRFSTNAERVKHREQLNTQLKPAFAVFNRQDCLDKLSTAGVPVGSIRNMKEVFDRPQAKDMILEDVMPDGSTGRRVKTVAFTMKQKRK